MRKILAWGGAGRGWQHSNWAQISHWPLPMSPKAFEMWTSQLPPQKAPPQEPWRPLGSLVATARPTPGQTSLSRGSCTSSLTSTLLSPLLPPLPSSSSPLSSSASSEAATTTFLKVSPPSQEPLHLRLEEAQTLRRPNLVSPDFQSGSTWKWLCRCPPRWLLFVLGSLLSVWQCPAGNNPLWWTQVWEWKPIWK